MKKIEITIIVPIFNRAEYLPGLFKCLRKQIFREYECILVDDGSWDESGELCDKFCEMDERFRVLHIDNAGVSHARNLGLSEAKGEYVVFVDSDDKIPDNYLTCLYKKITENKASIFICSIEKIWTSGKYQNIEMLPVEFQENNTIGINVSPLVIRKEKKPGIVYANLSKVICWILENTDCSITLIPHVVWENNDDRVPLNKLLKKFETTRRVVMIEDSNCNKLKGYISRCRLFIGARTHATIAAYSTCVPTLVLGYSIKSKGIATDLFGTDEKYVIPVQSLEQEDDLTRSFIWLWENEGMIRKKLQLIMPGYIQKASMLDEDIREYLGEKE